MDAASPFKSSQDWLVGDHVLMSWSFIKHVQDRRAETAFPPPPIRTVSGDKYLPGLLIIDKKTTQHLAAQRSQTCRSPKMTVKKEVGPEVTLADTNHCLLVAPDLQKLKHLLHPPPK